MPQLKLRFAVKTTIFFCGALLYCHNGLGDAPAINERIDAAVTTANLALLGTESETIWPSNPSNYLTIQVDLIKALISIGDSNPDSIRTIHDVEQRTMEKACPNDTVLAQVYFKSKLELVELMLKPLFASNSVAHPTPQDAQMIARFLGEVRAARITNYKEQTIYLNIAPPIVPKDQPGLSGMDPKAIHDPVARAAYEKAIAENNQRSQENSLQLRVLKPVDYSTMYCLKTYFTLYIRESYDETNFTELVGKLAKLGHLTEVEESSLLKIRRK